MLPVCAAGNDALDPKYSGGISYPARFAECLAVGATNWSDTKATYSNSGPELAISAPGGDRERLNFSAITSASITSDASYGVNIGTSESSAEVSGAAALLFATGWKDANKVKRRLLRTADDIEATGWDSRTGAGRLNVYRAVTGQEPSAPPVANPGGPYLEHTAVPVQFDGSASQDPNGKPVTLSWDFGDATSANNTSTDVKPTHAYARSGVYTVTLSVTDAAGLTITSRTTAKIIARPVSNPGGPYSTHKGVAVQFDGSASLDPDGNAVTLQWDFGDPRSANNASSALKPSHTYTRAGAYTVTLRVTDLLNLSVKASTTVTVPNIVPVVSFAGATILQGETYTTAGSFVDDDPDMWSASVDYADGVYAQALDLASTKTFMLSRRYMDAGINTVKVTVSDDDGGTGRGAAKVTIWTPQQGIQALLLDVLADSDLPTGTVNSLSAKLRAAQASLGRGMSKTALNQLNAFRNELDAVVKTGRMSSTLAAQLAGSEDRVEASINR